MGRQDLDCLKRCTKIFRSEAGEAEVEIMAKIFVLSETLKEIEAKNDFFLLSLGSNTV